MTSWKLASVWDGFAVTAPDRVAFRGGGRAVTWGLFADRATRLAWHFQAVVGLAPGDRVAIALTNRPEHLEVFYAALKLGCVPVNVDVRYGANEVHQVLDHSDAKAVVPASSITKAVKTAAKRIPKPWRPLVLAAGAPYETAIEGAPAPGEWRPPGSDRDDVVLVYASDRDDATRAVMWRNDDLHAALARWVTEPDATNVLPVAPLAHPAGLFAALTALSAGRTVVLVGDERFDPAVVWAVVARERVDWLAAVTEGSARSLLEVLATTPKQWDLSGLRTITLTGTSSATTQRAFAAHLPAVAIHEDPVVAETPGERTTGLADSAPAPIITAGTAVSASHIEVTLRKHPSVVDCVVIGVPDARAGERVVALVQVADNHYLDEAELTAWCRSKLRASETPRRFVFVASIDWSGGDGATREASRQVAISRLSNELR